MKGLILVDLDNVGHLGLDLLVERTLEATHKCPPTCEWMVVYALNTSTPERHGITFAELRKASRALGCKEPEIALALTMPQTADVLLARLAREAPSDEAAGAYEAAVLVSKDHDLADSLGHELYETAARGWVRSGRGFIALWQMPEDGTASTRRRPAAAKAHKTRTPELEQAHTLCIDDKSLASWAAERAPDGGVGLELEDLAYRIDEEPWLLSQLGATTGSMRGVARLAGLDASLLLGAIHPKDGVEVRGEGARPLAGDTPVAASVGIGALRLKSCGATVASRLAAGVVEKAGSCVVGRFEVSSRAVVQGLTADEALGKVVKVRMSTRGSARERVLVAKVEHSSVVQPQAWWMTGNKVATSEIRLEVDVVPYALDRIAAVSYKPRSAIRLGESECFLALRSIANEGDSVVVQADIAMGSIGLGMSMPAHGKPKPVAVYASRPLRAGDTVVVQPIHLAHPGKLPESCRVLPVMVAL